MTTALRIVRNGLRRIAAAEDRGLNVHFHQGPQGQATPCFDGDCPNPRMTV